MRLKVASFLAAAMLVISVPTTVMADENSGVEEFVERLYSIILDRDYDEQGYSSWVDGINSGRISANETARSFVLSEEFISRELTNEEFVDCLYRAILGRPADEAGLKAWCLSLDEGVSRSDVIDGFLYSGEWEDICKEYGLYSTSIAVSDGTTEFVKRLYSECLDREADDDGLRDWVLGISSGDISASDAISGFINSNEFVSHEYTDEEYVDKLYHIFMGRDADTAGLEAWTNLLNDGVSREYVLKGFTDSSEFMTICDYYGIDRGQIVLTQYRDLYPVVSKLVVYTHSLFDEFIDGQIINDEVEALIVRGEGGAWLVNSIASRLEVDAEGVTESEDFINRCNEAGITIQHRGVAPTYLSDDDQARINSQVHDLREAYDYSVGLTYYRFDADPNMGTQYFATMGFTTGHGNCYVMAATFLEMARNLGYTGVQISGEVPTRRGGLTPHSWVELYVGGQMYVFDPNFTNETGYNGWMINYGQSGTWRYVRGSEMN